MTREDACEYLGFSPYDKIDINKLEAAYNAKISISQDSREKLEEAMNILLEIYDAEHKPENKQEDKNEEKHEDLFMKLVVLMAGIFVLCFAGVIFFVYKIHSDNVKPARNEAVSSIEYNKILQELEQIKQSQQKEYLPPTVIKTNPDYTELVEKVMPSILFLRTNKATGSGFFVSSTGDILTNYHVIKGAEYITITTQNGQIFSALIKDFDTVRDMAMIKINPSSSVPFLKISNNLPKQGETVIAIGNPAGNTEIYNNTVSNGIVSAVRNVDNNLWVQFTASVTHGSSGGPVINLQGEVVGMTTWGDVAPHAQNLNFAVPSIMLSQFLSSAINKPVRELPKVAAKPAPKPEVQNKPDTHNHTEQDIARIPGMKFIRRDDGYAIYLYQDSIEYDKQTRLASFITCWWPTEKSKIKMRKDYHFNIPPGKDLGECLLLYLIDFENNTYLHLRTINFCTDGFIARDYPIPKNELTWKNPTKGSRIESLMKEVKKQLRIR